MNTRSKIRDFSPNRIGASCLIFRARAGKVQFSLPFALVCFTAACLVFAVCTQLIRIRDLEMERNWMAVNSDAIAIDKSSCVYVKNTSPNLPFSWEWNVYLPEGKEYWLNIRINDIPESGFPTAGQKGELVQFDGNAGAVDVPGSHFVTRLVPGRGSVGLCWRHVPEKGWHVCLVTAKHSISELTPATKNLPWLNPVPRGEEVFLIKDHQSNEHSLPMRYDMSGVGVHSHRFNTTSDQQEFTTDQDVELIRMRSVPLGGSDVGDGFMVWISTDDPFENTR